MGLGNWLHILIIAPFLFWMSINPNPILLSSAAVLVLLVHGWLLLIRGELEWLIPTSSSPSSSPPSPSSSVDYIHQTPTYSWEDYQLRLN